MYKGKILLQDRQSKVKLNKIAQKHTVANVTTDQNQPLD